MYRITRVYALAAAVLLVLCFSLTTGCTDRGNPAGSNDGNNNNTPGDTLTWVADILPDIIQPNCSACHGNQIANNGLNFSNFDGWIQSNSLAGNPYVVPGDPDASELVWRVEGSHSLIRMPQGGQLPNSEIQMIRTWIEQGAVKE